MAEEGDLNRNNQRLLRKTKFVYGANGSDFHLRRCPKCDGGAKGI